MSSHNSTSHLALSSSFESILSVPWRIGVTFLILSGYMAHADIPLVQPDILSTSCDHPPCPTPFTLFTRRHHCRRCGNIFCTSHSSHTVPLDQHARFHPAGSAGRACDSCWGDYLAWKKVRGRGSMSTEGSSGSVTPRGDGNGEVAVEGIKVKRVVKSAKEDVGSVPRDWNWSTF